MLKNMKVRIVQSLFAVHALVMVFLCSGCTALPGGFGKDLTGSTVAAVWGDVLFTLLDYILPRPPV